mmetsp:Transcript_68657/g.128076  ORF Transcript_68657/g.128076 Transcript_68657/m.128076 type:complete len:352 (+) Transcript_68657:54-1109(+)
MEGSITQTVAAVKPWYVGVAKDTAGGLTQMPAGAQLPMMPYDALSISQTVPYLPMNAEHRAGPVDTNMTRTHLSSQGVGRQFGRRDPPKTQGKSNMQAIPERVQLPDGQLVEPGLTLSAGKAFQHASNRQTPFMPSGLDMTCYAHDRNNSLVAAPPLPQKPLDGLSGTVDSLPRPAHRMQPHASNAAGGLPPNPNQTGLAETVESLQRPHAQRSAPFVLDKTRELTLLHAIREDTIHGPPAGSMCSQAAPPIPSSWAESLGGCTSCSSEAKGGQYVLRSPQILRHELRVLMGEGRVETVDFEAAASLGAVAQLFLQRHGLKPIVMEGLVERMRNMVAAQQGFATVDLVDLI